MFVRIIRLSAAKVKRCFKKTVFVFLIAGFSKIYKNDIRKLLTSLKQLVKINSNFYEKQTNVFYRRTLKRGAIHVHRHKEMLSQLVPTLVIWQCDAPEMSAPLD